MRLLAGVDGGATKTVALVGTPDGTLVGAARGPPSNYHNVGVRNAAMAIRTAVRAACRHGRAPPKELEVVVMGLAGMDSPGDFLMGDRVAKQLGLGKKRVVKHDSVIAVYCATLGKPGIVVNAGTGSFAAGLDSRGRVIRAGGWGRIIDDEGSAYHIGKLGIRVALRALDGSERKTAIAKLLVRKLKLPRLEQIVHEVHEKPMSVEEISAISKLVAQAATRGDRVARDIFTYEGRALAKLVATIARHLRMTHSSIDVYCTGGVFKSGTVILAPFKKELRRHVPRFAIRQPEFQPAIGAFVLALQEQGVETSGQILTNLRSSYARYVRNM